MRLIARHAPSPAMVVALIALLVSLSGVGYAAIVVPKNSVGTAQLKKDAVVSSKIKNGTLLARDFAKGQIPRGATGPAGPAGPAGSAGPAGPAGAAGSINGVAASGDLTGTYPAPTIAASAVTGTKIANGTVGFTKISGAAGQVNVDLPSIAAHTCITQNLTIGVTLNGGERIVVDPTLNLSGIVVTPYFDINTSHPLELQACNVTAAAIDAPSGAWAYLIWRP